MRLHPLLLGLLILAGQSAWSSCDYGPLVEKKALSVAWLSSRDLDQVREMRVANDTASYEKPHVDSVDHAFYVDGKIAGHLGLSAGSNKVTSFGVAPKHRSSGVGEKIVDWLVHECRGERGNIEWEVKPTDTYLASLLTKAGFEKSEIPGQATDLYTYDVENRVLPEIESKGSAGTIPIANAKLKFRPMEDKDLEHFEKWISKVYGDSGLASARVWDLDRDMKTYRTLAVFDGDGNPAGYIMAKTNEDAWQINRAVIDPKYNTTEVMGLALQQMMVEMKKNLVDTLDVRETATPVQMAAKKLDLKVNPAEVYNPQENTFSDTSEHAIRFRFNIPNDGKVAFDWNARPMKTAYSEPAIEQIRRVLRKNPRTQATYPDAEIDWSRYSVGQGHVLAPDTIKTVESKDGVPAAAYGVRSQLYANKRAILVFQWVNPAHNSEEGRRKIANEIANGPKSPGEICISEDDLPMQKTLENMGWEKIETAVEFEPQPNVTKRYIAYKRPKIAPLPPL